ncbi:1-acyl-sn-glycerol-3-phosphate acyltransferase [Sphaerisporangium rufum]|uniref:1-acyl-sn-glycerol-3-phosphate acyltransferase n=1 Tax=Sphaerisporangium rufum TaxID=1381558 RepID=A0A919QYL9_9ACTN|nr:lysophospholipid acyltransferase family protein [Sphaerisporangium rufum]GII76506.1 1-acyl-sn-glycerol-3-phosphate acyltransferase [Sphaerisporangium rufum]
MSRPGRPPIHWEALVVMIVKTVLYLFTKRDWRGAEHLPRQGGVIIAANHLSWTDPLMLAHYVYDGGRWPVYLAKSGVFDIPVIGSIIRKCKQIPVYRGSTDAARSLRHAEDALREGASVIFYPEGTITRDPDHWPMAGKTGVARLALATGVPVIPVAHWGAQELLPYGGRRPRLFPRKTFHALAGPPVDLSRYQGQPMRGKVLQEATADIMAAITAQLAELRGEKAPDDPFQAETRAG